MEKNQFFAETEKYLPEFFLDFNAAPIVTVNLIQ